MFSPKKIALVCLLATGCFLALFAGIPAADEQEWIQEMRELRHQVREACRESAKSLCEDTWGGRARLRCLMDNYDEVPSDCQAALDEVQEEREHRREMLAAACGASMDTVCPGREGRGAVRCLKRNYGQTSADCQAFLDEIPAWKGPRARARW